MSVSTYSPKRLVISVLGKNITGFSDDDMITVSLDEDKFVKFTSVDGESARSYNVSSAGKFVITLNQTSKANQTLSALLLADMADNTGQLTFPVAIRDLNSDGTFYLAKDCWLVGMPESSFNKEIENRVWTLDAADIKFNLAGSGTGLLGVLGL